MPDKETKLTPSERTELCMQIGDELGIDGAIIDKCCTLAVTREDLMRLRDTAAAAMRHERERQAYYSPAVGSEGIHPAAVEPPKTKGEIFADFARYALKM